MAWESKLQKKSLWTAPVEKSMFPKERVSRKRDDGTVNTLHKTPIGLTQGHNFNLLNLKPGVQAKLTVGAPGDKYEQEADNMASQVMSMPDSAVQRMAPEEQTEDDEVQTKHDAANITPLVQREEIPQEEEENKVQPKIDTSIQREVSSDEDELQAKPLLQRATDGSFQAGGNIESQLNNSKGGGSPLGDDVRAFMEPRFGADFSSVHVHTGDEAVQMNRELGAQAFTHGSDVYFGAGKAPGNNELMAHELTHVVQQTGMVQKEGGDKKNEESQSNLDSRRSNTQSKGHVTWLDLPHVHLMKGAKKEAKKGKLTLTTVENTPDADPTLTYASEEDIDLTSRSGEEIDDSTKKKIVADIIAARNAIPAREIERSPYGKPVGNFHDPARTKDDPIAAQYNQWSKGAKPTQKFDPSNPDDQKKWEIFKTMMPLEGRLGTITTFDKTLTIGVGFSSAGKQAEQVIGKSFDALPEVKSIAFQCGLIADIKTKSFSVVDAEKGWILDGTDASNYIQTNHALLSLIINVSQGRQTNQSGQAPSEDETVKQRQTMLDAQWTTFLENAINGIPPVILGWPINSVVLAVHCRHAISATFPWSFWEQNNNTDLKEMVGAIYKKLKQTDKLVWLYPICGGIYKPYADEIVAREEAPEFYKKLNGLQMSDMLKQLRQLAAQKTLKIRLDLYDGSYGGRPRIAMLAVLNRKSSKEDKQSIISTKDFDELPPDQQQMIKKELGLN